MNENEKRKKQLEQAQAKDSTDGGRSHAFMSEDLWNQEGSPVAADDEFGPEMKQEDPPTLNGKPT